MPPQDNTTTQVPAADTGVGQPAGNVVPPAPVEPTMPAPMAPVEPATPEPQAPVTPEPEAPVGQPAA